MNTADQLNVGDCITYYDRTYKRSMRIDSIRRGAATILTGEATTNADPKTPSQRKRQVTHVMLDGDTVKVW